MTAKEFWKQKFDEYPQNDSEKLAVTMMQEYRQHEQPSSEDKIPVRYAEGEDDIAFDFHKANEPKAVQQAAKEYVFKNNDFIGVPESKLFEAFLAGASFNKDAVEFVWTDELVKEMIYLKLPIPEHYAGNLQKCLDEFKNSDHHKDYNYE